MRRTFLVVAVAALCISATPAAALSIFSNGIYDVHVADAASFGSFGSWNAITAAGHPTGAGNDLLYDGTTVSTNFSSLRIYGAAGPLTYTFGGSGGGLDMDGLVSSEGASPYGAAGHRTTWTGLGAGVTLIQDVFVVGTGIGDSAIYHTVEIINTTGSAVDVGWRNLYDWAVNDPGFDDGPSNSIESIGSGVLVPTTTLEFIYTPGSDDYARVAAAPPPFSGATYEPLLGLGFDPGLHFLATTAPDTYAYVSWPGSVGTAFDYTPSGANVTSDSAGLSWWGRTAGSAYTVGADSSIRFTQTIYAVTPGDPPLSVVPEPGTLVLVGLGLAALGVGLRRRRTS